MISSKIFYDENHFTSKQTEHKLLLISEDLIPNMAFSFPSSQKFQGRP
jgi:hypothetical protein